jgi:coenzyme F420-reducing hydrogenase alpha subunit
MLFLVSVLELSSLYAVLELFTTVRSKEIENLRWISKIGNKNNTVARKYNFALPDHMKQTDNSKTVFEARINL